MIGVVSGNLRSATTGAVLAILLLSLAGAAGPACAASHCPMGDGPVAGASRACAAHATVAAAPCHGRGVRALSVCCSLARDEAPALPVGLISLGTPALDLAAPGGQVLTPVAVRLPGVPAPIEGSPPLCVGPPLYTLLATLLI